MTSLTIIFGNDQRMREERTWRFGRAHGQGRKRQFKYDEETHNHPTIAHIALAGK
jgi:hypothetical protein